MVNKIFQIDEQVSYTGQRYAEELSGKLGRIYARVDGTDHGVVVDFEKGSYIMDERHNLIPFNPALKAKKSREEMAKEAKVEHRPNKRKPAPSEEESD